MSVDVSVCVAVYRAHSEPNVASLHGSLAPALGGLRGELVVALNGISASAAGVPEAASAVSLPDNLGVAPGWNAAARAATGEFLVFANDDVVLGRGSLERLVAVLRERPEVGVVGPVGSNYDREAWRPIGMVDPAGGAVEECDAVSGFLFATRRATWVAVGGFDEAYAPASWEEIDFNCAVQRSGLRSYAIGGLGVRHEWGISRRQPPWRMLRWGGRRELLWSIHRRNRRHFLRKWAT
jgi:GT2 family glycosyltransferase